MITLVLPVYNMEQYLLRCMNTLLVQQGDYEIIMVDDGSTDHSPEICDCFAEKYPTRIKVLHKANGGLSSARNAGMDAASGQYVIFPDPDDWVEPDYIQRLEELQKQYHPDLLCFGYYIDYDDKCLIPVKEQAVINMDRKNAQKALLVSPCMGGFAWNKLYHLDIIRRHNLRFLDDVGTTEDLDFAYRYLEYCQIICFDSTSRLYHYYQRSDAATHSGFSNRKLDAIRTYEKMIETSEDDILICAAKEDICNTAVNLIWIYQNSGIDDDEIWETLHQYIHKYLKCYCNSKRYNMGRKIQAVLACYVPKIYAWLKNRVSKDARR